MADPLAVAFEALLAGIALLLLASDFSFVRMNPDVRRVRLFVMAGRIHRVLLSFSLGFVAIAVVFVFAFAGLTLPPAVTSVVVFFWLGAVLYGSIEILLVARPDLLNSGSPRRRNHRRGAE